ncbi:MAG: heavy-metal-associated domain-containing protein [Thiotrichaceae bacterium]|nr:heavy-metal-associated domain-containing protein [Thiotrichaceae bacterium]
MQLSSDNTYQLRIADMSCMHCVNRVNKAALAVSDVESIEVDLENGTAIVVGGVPHKVIEAINNAGYPTIPVTETPQFCSTDAASSKIQSEPDSLEPKQNS